MLKLVVPIAHASNMASGEHPTGFFATLCSANKTIFVPLDLPVKQDAPSKANQTQDKCPLCVVAEQSDADISISPAFKAFAAFSVSFSTNYAPLFQVSATDLAAIRAPPLFSKLI